MMSFTWHRHAAEIADEWRTCFGDDDIMRSFELQQAVEASHLEDVDIHYLVGRDDQGVACVIPCFGFRFVLVNLATPWLRQLVGGIRQIFPGFLRARLWVVGSAVTTCGDHLGFKDFADVRRWHPGRIAAVFAEIERKAASMRLSLIVIKELAEDPAERLRTAIGDRYFFAASLPTTHVSIAPRLQGGYYQSIRSKYRNTLKKRKAVGAAAGLTWETAPNCTGHEETIYQLYSQVVDHSDFVFEKVNRAFFQEVDKALAGRVFYHFGFRTPPGDDGSNKKLVAVELVLCDGDTMHPFYSGFDYWIKKDSDLYFNAF